MVKWLHNVWNKGQEGKQMSYADRVFIDMCRDIIDNGTDTRGETGLYSEEIRSH